MIKFLVGLPALLLCTQIAAFPVVVTFDTPTHAPAVGDTFAVDLLADIPDPVLGWGLDVSFDPTVLVQSAGPVVGGSWSASPGGDLDGLAGLTFAPVSGAGILLATLTFEVLSADTSALAASVTPGDLTEGFALLGGGFADLDLVDASITTRAVSLPGTMLMLLAGLAGMRIRGASGRASMSHSL